MLVKFRFYVVKFIKGIVSGMTSMNNGKKNKSCYLVDLAPQNASVVLPCLRAKSK